MKGSELDKQIYSEGEITWGCKFGWLDVEDVKKSLFEFMSKIFSSGDYDDVCLTPKQVEFELASEMGDKLINSQQKKDKISSSSCLETRSKLEEDNRKCKTKDVDNHADILRDLKKRLELYGELINFGRKEEVDEIMVIRLDDFNEIFKKYEVKP